MACFNGRLIASHLSRQRCPPCVVTGVILRRNQKRLFSKDDKTNRLQEIESSDSGREQKPRKAPSLDGAERRKKSTLDHFFSKLGSTNRKPSRRRSFNKITEQQNSGSKDFLILPRRDCEKETAPKLDMTTFFNEVNEMMAIRKASEQKMAMNQEELEQHSSSKPSILDLLPRDRKRGPDAYDEDAFDQYFEILETVVEDPSFLRKRRETSRLDESKLSAVIDWLRAEEPIVKCFLPTLANLSGADWDEDSLRTNLRNELNAQKNRFLEHHGWEQTQYEVAVRSLLRMGNLCARKGAGTPAEVAWEKLKEAGFKMDQDTVQNYLYVTSTFSSPLAHNPLFQGGSVLDLLGDPSFGDATDGASSSIPSKPIDNSADVATEVALCHDVLFGASEQSTSIRVRRLVSQGKPAAAEKLLDNNASDELRLRTYDPVFQCYLEQNNIASAFKLYCKMRQGETVHLRPETYIQLISGIAENGFFCPSAPAIDGARDLGYEYASGPKLFDRLSEELSNDAVEISAAAAKRLYNALSKGFEGHNMKPLHFLQSLEVRNDPADISELIASRVSLDASTGECPRTGVRLRLINLDDEQKERLKQGLHYLAASAYEERSGKDAGAKAEENLRSFGDWLAKRNAEPFTAIVDGPNVGYYFQNFDQGTFNFHQIQFVVDALEDMGEKVLVILPKKYTQNSFMLTNASGQRRQTLSPKERNICDGLISSGKAFIVPPSFLDDYYWMYASVSGQGAKWTSDLQYVPPDNQEGRWPGIRPILVSNDKMRDHKLSLLEPRLFRRWYSNFIINFTFSAFVGDQCVDREIGFRTADFYSREIQGNPVLDDKGSDCGIAWHFPVSDWEENESFCVRIPSN